jgi:hypothetical protein
MIIIVLIIIMNKKYIRKILNINFVIFYRSHIEMKKT